LQVDDANTDKSREFSDVDVVRLVLDWKLASQRELRPVIQQRQSGRPKKPLLTELIEEGIVTPKQAARMEAELATAEKVDQRIPGYQLLERIGAGGMGVVYRAKQLRMDRLVAIKLLKPKYSRNVHYVERFLREAKLAAKLSHNHIVQAIDAGEAYGHHYFVMEYVEGTSVGEMLVKHGPFEESEAIRIVLQIALALEHASKRGMVHRDIKPENILITPEGVAKLADMGLARFAEDAESETMDRGLIVGTVFFISPEQIRGEAEIDSRADIYSLGATLYTMMTGKPPFEGTQAREVLVKHLERPPTPLNRMGLQVSDGLSVVVETMLAKSRQDRYPTPGDLAFDLECLASGKPPRLAQERISVRTLAELSEGEPIAVRRTVASRMGIDKTEAGATSSGWLAGLSIALFISMLVNVFVLMNR
jgi:eukaryotic-like serine/threonine-protein kinase